MKKSLLLFLLLISYSAFSQPVSEGWDFLYPTDRFTEDALLDLRYLNEDIAGENGFIRQSPDGEGFVNGRGAPIRFWAINGGELSRSFRTSQLRDFARFLAKMGVNMIRFHGQIHAVSDDINEVNKSEVDDIWRLVAVMKEEGIYTTISPYWPNFVDEIPPSWGLGDYTDGPKPWALMYFEPKLKEAYKKWVEYLYTETNPYTGIALQDDPAVALIQIQNEDGLLFWTIQGVEPSLQAQIESRFYDWLVGKYGNINEVYEAWNNVTLPEDDVNQGRMGTYIIWEATQERSGGKDRRISDQIQFLSETQRAFYREIYDHYRAIGCSQLINATNWKTASAPRLFDAERWTYEACDVMAVNRYYAPQHTGENSGWRIDPGHHFVGESVLGQPHKLPINIKQPAGYPFLVTESGWNLPHEYQAEGPFLIAAYQSLTGVDGFYWFSPSAKNYDSNPYFTFLNFNGQHPLKRWTLSTPGQLAMFPANALMYRQEYIQPGQPVVQEERSLQALWDREIPLITEENSFDPNRDSYDNPDGSEQTDIAPIAYLAGPVKVQYGTEAPNSDISPNLPELLNFQEKIIHSSTGELQWDYQQRLCRLDAPSAQGLCGFIEKGQSYEMADISLSSTNDYVVVNVVAMDEKPLSSSEKILIQIGTRYRPTDWKESPASFEFRGEQVEGFRVDDTGRMPWKSANTEVILTIRNPNIRSAHQLDPAGYEREEIDIERDEAGNAVTLRFPADAMYVIADTRLSTAVPASPPGHGTIRLFPNPTEGPLRIEIPSDQLLYDKIEIQDTSGRILRQFETTGNQYALESLPPGMYLVVLRREGKILATQRIIIH